MGERSQVAQGSHDSKRQSQKLNPQGSEIQFAFLLHFAASLSQSDCVTISDSFGVSIIHEIVNMGRQRIY